MASSIAVSRLAAAKVSLGSLLADNGKGYYEQQYNRITGHSTSDVSHSAKPHSTNKVEEEDDDDGGVNIIPPSCNEDEDDSEDEDEDDVEHETTKTTIERRRKKATMSS